MIFGDIPIDEAHGCILAHTVRMNGDVLKKGVTLARIDIERLRDHGMQTVMAARPSPADVLEDEAAARIAKAITGAGVIAAAAFTGRANLFAEKDGVFVADAENIKALNRIDQAMTIATLPPHARVSAGQMVATAKIIPFAVSKDRLMALEADARADGMGISVSPFQTKRVALVLSQLPGDTAKIIKKRHRAVAERLASLAGDLIDVGQCDHTLSAVSDAISHADAQDCDLILVFGASAIVDRADVIPAALESGGGEIVHLGMPVDPGNLLLYGRLSGKHVVGVPSCAASIKENGFDWILERLFANLPVGREEIIAMAPGGLLMEIPTRPQPRERATAFGEPEPNDAARAVDAK